MNQDDIEQVLKIVLEKLKGRHFNWRLEGSANLIIQGVDTTVNDLDITTDDEGIGIFREALKGYITKDFYSEKIKGRSLVCKIDNQEVEINSYGDRELDMFDKTEIIQWNNLKIPLLPLGYAKIFYKLIEREDKVRLISNHLDQNIH
ncbi:hypothetical protein COV93_03990 [Candidatus Woesearchaeota archaeon CG11_big_fil_rev_8_21_14_0_20_43_8]|nr:MAG: hypothetical protein COV93_03990 [Candidatus Woesearchaeota archaeon CG11_big_fil_rev_8_21_14_0_20_43_8]PIO04892.1 MAG: hypothetical protein COT47_07055 [Candidatus Woesearchaeota archaeon CG08_land_8_20_14_0_20_43_7]